MINNSGFSDFNEIGPIQTNNYGESYLYNINRNTFEKINSHTLFDSKFSEQLFESDFLNIIIGTDSGLLPKYLMDKGLPKGSRYIFVEPSAILTQLMANQLIGELDPAIVCISLDQWQRHTELFKIQDYFYINSVRSFNAICAEDDNCNVYAELSWHITEVLTQYHWNINMTLGNETFTSRQLVNLADNLLPASKLQNVFKNKTVIILAGGPSLDDALVWVKSHRNQIVVFSVSRISRQLKQAKIEPDFVFSVDPTELSFDISKEMLTFSLKPIFVYSFHTVSTLVNQWHGLKFYLGPRVPWKSALNDNNISGTGPTVTNTALSAAHAFGFKRIILAGVDFCFTRDGYTHAKGSDEHIAGPRFNLTSLQVETNGGNLAPTSCDLAAAIQTLGIQAKKIVATGCQIINSSVNAAKISDVDYVPLTDIELEADEIDVLSIVHQGLSIESQSNINRKEVVNELQRVRFQVHAIGEMAAKALRLNQKMFNDDGIIENYKDKRSLDKIEKTLNREYRRYSRLIKQFGIRSFIKMTKPFTDEDWTADEVKSFGNSYYEIYRDGTKKLLNLLDDAIERINCRTEEMKDQPDFSRLISQWNKDRSFTRASIWREQHPGAVIPEIVKMQFAELDGKFQSVLNDKNTAHMARAKSYTSLAYLKKRAALLFKHQKIPELENLLASLLKHEQQEDVEPYRHLIQGYLLELNGDSESALHAYQFIIDYQDAPLLEEALLRIASISIDTQDINNINAYLSLQCLSEINPIYLPFYADILRLRGAPEASLEAYREYMGLFPDDHLVQIKLVTVLMENEMYEVAAVLVDYLLIKQPNLKAVIEFKNRLEDKVLPH